MKCQRSHHLSGIWIALFFTALLLVACEEIPEETEERPHRISLETDKISTDPLFPGSILSYNYTITNIGREDAFDVALEIRMRKKTTGQIIKTEGEIVSMALVSFKEKGIVIPSDAPKGEYELAVVATYDGGTDADTFTFTVDREEPEINTTQTESKNKTQEKSNNTLTLQMVQETAPKPVEVPKNNATVRIVIQSYRYVPSFVNISIGTTVEWYNNDSVPHSATGPGFDSGPLPRGEVYSFTFTKKAIKHYSSTYTDAEAGVVEIHG